MYYSAKELKDKLSERVIGLGIDKRFLENPAFASAISEIESLIGQMNMGSALETVTVKEEDGNISFDWTASYGDKYSISISSSSPETFRCVRIEEKKSFIGTNGQSIRQKDVVEKVATIEEDGAITLTINSSMIDNTDCRIGKCDNFTGSEKKYYTSDGVMWSRENKTFPKGELSVNFDSASIDSMLYIPRQAFDFGFIHDKYETKTYLLRDKLDTAYMVYENKRNGSRYMGMTPLKQEHGLRDMETLDGYAQYREHVVIPPLSQEEVEAMIQRESNPKVAEGLRKYAVGRNTYSYNSDEDEKFICEGISQSQGKSR